MIVFPLAKINIGLHVLNRRADGYHDIESAFYPVPLCDILEVTRLKRGMETIFTESGLISGCTADENLVMKAYRLLKKSHRLLPVKIHLHKNIPSGAGLGGGSSDAGYMLTALNELFGLKLPDKELKKYALELGSDCPFFIHPKPSVATGRGELLTSAKVDINGFFIMIVKPPVHISTKEAYGLIRSDTKRPAIAELIQKPIDKWEGCIHNDFFNPIAIKHPVIADIRENMYRAGAVYSSMTGSGSAVYGLFKQEEQMKNINYPDFFQFRGLINN